MGERWDTSWEPVLYAFAANPANPGNVQPLWVQPLGVKRSTSVTPWSALQSYAQYDLVTGTDGYHYCCTQSQRAGTDAQPVTGSVWSDYWSVQSTPYRWVTTPVPPPAV